jgi:hypothetical protein
VFFSCLTSCCNINNHHIHICSDYLCLSNRLNFCYCHIFPLKHLLHFSKLWMLPIILCPFEPQMWHAYEDVFCGFRLSCVASMVITVVCFFFFLHVSTL